VLAPKNISELNVTLTDWISNLFPLPQNNDWQEILRDTSSPFSSASSERFANLLDQCVAVKGISAKLPQFLPVLLSCGTPETALTQLLDFTVAFRIRTGRDFSWNRPDTAAFLYIFGRSNFLAIRLKRNPELADKLLDSPFLLQQKSLEVMETELRKRIEQRPEFSLAEFKNILRRYKYEEYLRITVRDLAQLCPFKETLEELSAIAICSLRAALSGITKHELGLSNLPVKQTNPAENAASGIESKPAQGSEPEEIFPFMILGMGKLGGYELNYSSDVDLIFIHDNEELTGDPEADYKLRIKAAKILIDVMADVTEEGFLARMDMRLRPGGDRAHLVQSLDEMEIYYSSSGELWERQALIKAVPVAGSVQSGKDFMSMIKPFVFRSLLDEAVLHDVEKVKKRIEEEHLRESFLNVKLGVGGIREIEFFVQTFQLLYGGGKPELRSPATLDVLEKLRDAELIPQRDADTLAKAYLFLRRVEHHLQLREEQQTHTMPSDIEQQQQIARNLAYAEFDLEEARQQLLSDLKDVMGSVRAVFSGLFSRKHLEIEAAILNCAKIQSFTAEEQQFIELFSQHLAPLMHESTKNKFQRLFEAVSVKIGYYRKLSKHPSSLSRLMRIAETSEMLWNYLLNHLDLLDQLDNSRLEISAENWTAQLEDMLLCCADNEEDEIDQLRQFKHTITFLLGSAEMEGVLSYERTRIGLTILAEVIVQAAFRLSQKWLTQRYGEVKNKLGESGQFAIIGLGKLGGSELTYFSDLDLIFIHSGEGFTGGENGIGAQEYWIKLIQRLISCLSTITRTGYAYKLDARLRPSGNAGVLVTPLDIYLKYHEKSQPWEHQALIKGRVIGGKGEAKWFKEVEDGIRSAVYEWIPPEDMNAQINHFRLRKEQELSGENENRKNIKVGRGGLLDIEFLTQALQLKYGRDYPQLRCPKTMDALLKLGELNLIDLEEAQNLRYNYKLLRLIENGLRLIYDESTDLLDFEKVQTETILQLLKHHGYEVSNLRETVENVTQKVREIYLQYF
jgi:glutamate-ammonia-ligase adenylyltransferase